MLTQEQIDSKPWTWNELSLQTGEPSNRTNITEMRTDMHGFHFLSISTAHRRQIAATPDARRILRHLKEYVEAGEPLVHLGALMPEDGFDGAPDDQTLADAIRAYFAKTGE